MPTPVVSSAPVAILGYLLQHRLFGCCKIIGVDGARIEVRLCDSGDHRIFSRAAVEGGDFRRTRLHAGSLAIGPHGQCSVIAVSEANPGSPRHYRIIYEENGLGATVSEIELLPLAASLTDTLPNRVLEGRSDAYAMFDARNKLLIALARFNRQAGGLRALLASRIDLHPHQAYVAGTVILDPVRRYILADEVGLGKTIEAGIILHDLLGWRPDARILVLAPGPLTRQWLCEMHSSFGGQGFRLADLHPIKDVKLEHWSKVICSTNFALDGLASELVAVRWDLVVVDEVHHLLDASHLYDLVHMLSSKARDLLLLSAVPVRRRESELYRLLALLDPQTYGAAGAGEEAFLAIYAAQEPLGRRLNLLAHDLTDLDAGEAEPADVLSRLNRLVSLPILAVDAELQAMVAAAEAEPNRVGAIAREAHMRVSDRYRVNRRILRNRRERLISQDRLTAIRRVPALHQFVTDQIEADAVAAVETLLGDLARRDDLSREVLRPFARILLQALCDPQAVLDVLAAIAAATQATVSSYGREMLNAVVGIGGERWRVLLDIACAGVKAHCDPHHLNEAIRRATNWRASQTSAARWDTLAALLTAERAGGRKTLAFAGFPGVAARLAERLRVMLGAETVIEFRSDLDDMAKEENVRRFRFDPRVTVMVSDESGGEGRNFQFAHSLIHADLPWQPAVIEQRIGRLDRLGRDLVSCEVVSHVLVSAGSWEAGLYACYHGGLDLFGTSVSGLEFALRHLQDEIVDAALTGGEDALHALAPVLKDQAKEERARDDGEALLDEASYHAARAERFVRTPSPDSELALEATFLNYFRALGGGKSVARHRGEDGVEGLWSLRPDDLPNGEITIIDKDAAGGLRRRVGTFRRDIARQHREAEFFTYGNPLFDAVVAALGSKLTARSYAIACQAPGAPNFIGLELIITARPRTEGTDISPSLLNLAEALFGSRRRPLFVPLIAGQPVDGPALRTFRMSLLPDGPRYRDLGSDEVQHLVARQGGDLAECLRVIQHEVIPDVRRILAQELSEPLGMEITRTIAHRRQLLADNDAAAKAEAAMLERYQALIEGWDIVIDSLGFLALNVRR